MFGIRAIEPLAPVRWQAGLYFSAGVNRHAPRDAAPANSLNYPKSAMDKTYEPHAIESRWYAFWEERGHFAPSGQGEPYCIMIPPPNVTGTLHMGHAF